MLDLEIEFHEDVVRFGKRLQIRGGSVRIRLGPPADSDYIKVEHDEQLHEVRVLHCRPAGEDECVYSVLLEEV